MYGFILNISVIGRQPLGAFRMLHPVFSRTLFTPQPRVALPGAEVVEDRFAISSILDLYVGIKQSRLSEVHGEI